jgi:acyl dehydratase
VATIARVEGSNETLDTSDVDRYVGQVVGGGQLNEPITATDIRRWVQAMDYPNPRHFDDAAAASSPFGQIVAPQSFAVCCDTGQGCPAAIVGKIPNTHTVFGGDEWWFYGPQIRPGDHVRVRRRYQGYKMAETRFAGPTMFTFGDTLYLNERKEPIAKQRCTMARYRPDLARQRGYFDAMVSSPSFSPDELQAFKRLRTAWLRSGESRQGPGESRVGDVLPIRPIGPHTRTGFATEWRAFLFTVWGSQHIEGDFELDAGWLPEMMGSEADGSDPAMRTGMDEGPGSSHANLDKARLVGLPRHYGFGTSMGTWALDYLAYWAGDAGFIRHSNMVYRSPVFEGDVAFLQGEVTGHRVEPAIGALLVTVRINLTSQDKLLLAQGEAQVQLSAL